MGVIRHILAVLVVLVASVSCGPQEIQTIHSERDPLDTTTKRERLQFEFSTDYDPPAFTRIPLGLTFSCTGRTPGYYADKQAKCQVYHLCMPDSRSYTMLCGIGTVFNQRTFVCDHFYNYNCQEVENDYKLNDELWEDVLLPYSSGRARPRHQNRLQEDDDEDENSSEERR